MKPLLSKPSEACGKGPVVGFCFADDSGNLLRLGGDAGAAPFVMPLCGPHYQQAKKRFATAVNLGDLSLARNKAMVCYERLAGPAPPEEPPVASEPEAAPEEAPPQAVPRMRRRRF